MPCTVPSFYKELLKNSNFDSLSEELQQEIDSQGPHWNFTSPPRAWCSRTFTSTYGIYFDETSIEKVYREFMGNNRKTIDDLEKELSFELNKDEYHIYNPTIADLKREYKYHLCNKEVIPTFSFSRTTTITIPFDFQVIAGTNCTVYRSNYDPFMISYCL